MVREELAERTGDRETSKSPLLLEVACFADCCGGGENNGLQDEAVFVSLHLSDHLRLLVWGAVVMNDAESTEQGHMDGHLVLGDSVHGRGKERGLEGDALGHR